MILVKKDSYNHLHHSDSGIVGKSNDTNGAENDGSDWLFLVVASLILSIIIFYTS
jgi:hypothetical protein